MNKLSCNTITRRCIAFLMAAVTLLLMLSMTGCAANDWEGSWTRTGDATYARAEMTITEAGGRDFVFSITMYNGNVAGRLTDMTARYTDSGKTTARCTIPETRAYIDFALDDYGNIDVTYGYEVLSENTIGIIESELFGFDAPAYVTGHYTRDEVEYLNSNLYQAGILSAEEDERVRTMMTDSNYLRLLDCFQLWKVSNGKEDVNEKGYDPHSRKNRHEDEIGGYVIYGSNTMQDHAAIIIVYDDGTASVVVTFEDGAPIYYSSNAIYKDGSLTPLPIKKWLEEYHKEQENLLAAAAAAQQTQP